MTSNATHRNVPCILGSICEINFEELWPSLKDNISVEVILDTGATIPMPLSRVLDENLCVSKQLNRFLKLYKATQFCVSQAPFQRPTCLNLKSVPYDCDLLQQKHLYMLHIASNGWKTDFHHDLGCETYCQILRGKKIIQIWSPQNTYRHFHEKIDLKNLSFDWEFVLTPNHCLYIPAGCGHKVETLSEIAIMSTGSFLTPNSFLIGWFFNKFVDASYNGENIDTFDNLWENMLDLISASGSDFEEENVKTSEDHIIEEGKSLSKISSTKKATLNLKQKFKTLSSIFGNPFEDWSDFDINNFLRNTSSSGEKEEN